MNRKQNEMKRKKSNQSVDSTLPTSEIPENQEIRIPICLKTEKKWFKLKNRELSFFVRRRLDHFFSLCNMRLRLSTTVFLFRTGLVRLFWGYLQWLIMLVLWISFMIFVFLIMSELRALGIDNLFVWFIENSDVALCSFGRPVHFLN